MPSKSAKQRRFMAAAANNPDFAKRAGIPQSVAREYHDADRARMYEGGLAPMDDIMQRGMAGGLERLAPGFRKGGKLTKAERRARREAEGYEKRPKGRGTSGDSSAWSFGAGFAGSSRKRKGWRAVNPQTKSGAERRKRRWAKRQQEEGRWGDEVLTDVTNPVRRRNLVRAGWIPVRDPNRKVPKTGRGRESKKYKYGLDKNTVFYPPEQVQIGGGGVGLPRTIQRRDPMSYIGSAEGGQVEPVNMFYGGPLRRRMNEMLAAQQKQREAQDPDYEEWMYYGTGPVSWKDIPGGSTIKKMIHLARMKKLGWVPDKEGEDLDAKSITWYPPQRTPFGQAGDEGGGTGYIPPASAGDTGGFTEGGIDPTAGLGRRGGRRGRTPPGRGYTPPEPRDVPGGATPPGRTDDGGLVPPAQPPVDYTPPDPRAGRDTAFSEALRAHRARVAQLLSPGMAEGGDVRGYAEGGTSRADNPYPKGSARWKLWERKHGRDPDAPEPEPEAPPVAQAEEEEDTSLLGRLFGRSERELEELEERARGGYMGVGGYIPASREVGYGVGGYIPASREVGYQMGGLAEAMRIRPPMGGVPPRVEMQMGGMVPYRGMMRRMPPPPRMSPPLKMPPGMRIAPPPGKEMPAGPVGGPRVPPNLRGFLQRRMMENRPRRAIPGPAGAGGAPNRVGQSDQQGGLARALQRGTGRAPMSRRQGFYR